MQHQWCVCWLQARGDLTHRTDAQLCTQLTPSLLRLVRCELRVVTRCLLPASYFRFSDPPYALARPSLVFATRYLTLATCYLLLPSRLLQTIELVPLREGAEIHKLRTVGASLNRPCKRMGWDGMEWNGKGWDWMRRVEWDRVGWDGIGWDWMGWGEMG